MDRLAQASGPKPHGFDSLCRGAAPKGAVWHGPEKYPQARSWECEPSRRRQQGTSSICVRLTADEVSDTLANFCADFGEANAHPLFFVGSDNKALHLKWQLLSRQAK